MLSEQQYLELFSDGRIRPAIQAIAATIPGSLTGVEVGVQYGDHAKQIIDTLPTEMLYLVDVWGPCESGGVLVDFTSGYQIVLEKFKNYNNVTAMKMDSLSASKIIVDEELDFAYIDASHSYIDVLADIHAWWPKIRNGGMLCGHDYCDRWPGVMQSVDEFSNGRELHTKDWDWWILKISDEYRRYLRKT